VALFSSAVSSRAPRIYLARHGQTAYNLERRFQGQLPVPLDDTGRAQAAELAKRATEHDFAVMWCSPLRRARETADIIARRLGLEPREDKRLMETDAGDWTDRTFAEVESEAPDQLARFLGGDPTFAFPGGESFAQQGVRVAAALYDIKHAETPALVVCHGVVIRIALFQRSEQGAALADPVPNASLIALDSRKARDGLSGGDEVAVAPR
jgi:broad specificity phosphatase PhoE